ncbi:hypothetical protein [Clostridium thermobutyricum]|uniref:hypothetical protein n=1 Tax=Clostridium thermobutyricum TaxID=29372 RepID=UPI003F524DA2
MRKKKRDMGNIYIGISVLLSILLISGGIIFKGLKKGDEYKPLAVEKEEPEEKKDNLLLAFIKDKKLEGISFLNIDKNNNKITGDNYPKEFLVENKEELIKLERLYTSEKKFEKSMLQKNFEIDDFSYIEVDVDIVSKYIKYDKNFINNIFLKSLELTQEEKNEFYKGFKIIDRKTKLSKEEYEELLGKISEEDLKIEKAEFKTVTLEEIIDKNAIEILTEEEKKIKISYRNEEQLRNYKGYIDIKEKEKIKLEEKKAIIESTNNNLNVTSNNSSVGTSNVNGVNSNTYNSNSSNNSTNRPSTNTKPNGNVTKPNDNVIKPSDNVTKPNKPNSDKPTETPPIQEENSNTKPPSENVDKEEPTTPPTNTESSNPNENKQE